MIDKVMFDVFIVDDSSIFSSVKLIEYSGHANEYKKSIYLNLCYYF